jgi:hypothetical protein
MTRVSGFSFFRACSSGRHYSIHLCYLWHCLRLNYRHMHKHSREYIGFGNHVFMHCNTGIILKAQS